MSQSPNQFPHLKDYLVRPPQMEDVEIAVELFNICSLEVVGKKQYEASDFEMNWQTPNFNKETSIRLVLTPLGQLVGYCAVNDLAEPYVRINVAVRVHPDFREDGIGKALLEWGENRARQAVKKAPDGAEVFITTGLNQKDSYHKELVESHDMQIVRHFFRMEVEFVGPPEQPLLPEGIVIRPYSEETELRAMAEAYLDSFRDHYGFAEESIEKLLENIRFMVNNDPQYTPEMWFVAVEGEEIAGLSVCRPETTEDPEMGFVDVLGVRRQWRRRGLGLALLLHSFGEFHRRGSKRAGLGVDASSLTGATRLYEKGGMVVREQFDSYKKVLREGKDITTTSL